MAQWLRPLDGLLEDFLIASKYPCQTVPNQLQPISKDPTPYSGFFRHLQRYGACVCVRMRAHKHTHTIYFLLFKQKH